MIEYLLQGTLLGLSAGLAPGPLLALLLVESLSRGLRAGALVALAPLVTDLPIVVLTLWGLSALGSGSRVIGILSVLGAVVVAHLGIQNLRARGAALPAGLSDRPTNAGVSSEARGRPGSLFRSFRDAAPPRHPLRKGALVNALSPHPYLFWLTVGGPIVLRGLAERPSAAASFVAVFYALLVGSKLALAVAADRSRRFLSARAYWRVLHLLGVVLCFYSLSLLLEGLRLLGLET